MELIPDDDILLAVQNVVVIGERQVSYADLRWRAPKSRGETKLKVSQSQVAESGLGSTLPVSNSRKG